MKDIVKLEAVRKSPDFMHYAEIGQGIGKSGRMLTNKKLKYMTSEQEDTLNYYIGYGDIKRANAYIDELDWELGSREKKAKNINSPSKDDYLAGLDLANPFKNIAQQAKQGEQAKQPTQAEVPNQSQGFGLDTPLNNKVFAQFTDEEKKLPITVVGHGGNRLVEFINPQSLEAVSHEKEKDGKEESNFFQKLGNWTESAGQSFNRDILQTVDFLLPTELIWGKENDLVSQAANYYSDQAQAWTQKAIDSTQTEWGKKIGNLYSIGLQSIPQVILAMMTAGGSSAASLGSAAASVGKMSMSKIIKESAKGFSENPSYWISVAKLAGPSYEENIKNGANEFEATMSALMSSGVNAGIETMGGIESYGKNGYNAINRLAKSALEESVGLAGQYSVENATNKLGYAHGMPLYSTSEPAVFNPKAQGEAFLDNALVAAAVGGGQRATGKALNSMMARSNTANTRASSQGEFPLGESGKKALEYILRGKPPRGRFADVPMAVKQFGNYYEAGKLKLPLEMVPKDLGYKEVFTDEQKVHAWFAGINDAK